MGKNRLLGVKRETRDTEDDELNEKYKTKEEQEDDKNKSGEQDAGDSNEKGSETKNENGTKKTSLFGDLGAVKTGGLFGNLGGEEKKTEFKLFGNTGSSNLFSNSSLFSNSGASSSLFSSKPLFNFTSLGSGAGSTFLSGNKQDTKADEDKSDEEGEGENDLFQSSNSPNPYNPTEKTEIQKEKSIYDKKYLKEIENIFVYVKDEGKYVSKGKGFLSLEYADVDNKKVGVIVFRNTMGNKIIEGFLTSSLKTFTKYVKNFKHVASISFLQKGKEGKFEIGYCKIPYAREEDLKDFEKSFNELIELLTPSTATADDDKEDKKETKSEDNNKTEETAK